MRVLHQSSASLLHFCADSCPVRQHRIGCGPAAVRLASGLMLAICCSLAGTGRAEVVLQPLDGTGKQGPNLVPNGGFEEIADNMPAGWKSQLPGTPMIDRQCVHGGKASLRFTKPDASTRFWVSRTIEINQPKAAPLVLSGWSKAEAVTGTKTAEYSVWVDLQYTDGTSLWGQRVLFDVGTHDWQHVEFPFVVSKPVKRASVSVLFRGACRFVYNSWLNLFYAAHDFGLAKEPRKYPSSADFQLSLYRHEPAWGFRAAAAGYYDRFPQFFQQRLRERDEAAAETRRQIEAAQPRRENLREVLLARARAKGLLRDSTRDFSPL
jgi:hypothetical protein